jgi:hypothetical protein
MVSNFNQLFLVILNTGFSLNNCEHKTIFQQQTQSSRARELVFTKSWNRFTHLVLVNTDEIVSPVFELQNSQTSQLTRIIKKYPKYLTIIRRRRGDYREYSPRLCFNQVPSERVIETKLRHFEIKPT